MSFTVAGASPLTNWVWPSKSTVVIDPSFVFTEKEWPGDFHHRPQDVFHATVSEGQGAQDQNPNQQA